MLKLGQTELFSERLNPGKKMAMANAIEQKLKININTIQPDKISLELQKLKIKSKNKYYPLLNEAIALYESSHNIKLFNFSPSEGTTSIPPYIPFMGGTGSDIGIIDGNSKNYYNCVYMNLYGIGKWNQDGSEYIGLNAITDLYSILETGVINYSMLFEGKADKVLSNSIVIENLVKIYTAMFANAVVRVATVFGTDFNVDAAYFLISKFFLKHCLEMPDSDTLNNYASFSIKHRTSVPALLAYEENVDMSYETLTIFLKKLGETFFNEPITISGFEKAWITMYGGGLIFAIEYVPFLLHFLFASVHNANLGGSTRLSGKANKSVNGNDLIKLYNAVISSLR